MSTDEQHPAMCDVCGRESESTESCTCGVEVCDSCIDLHYPCELATEALGRDEGAS